MAGDWLCQMVQHLCILWTDQPQDGLPLAYTHALFRLRLARGHPALFLDLLLRGAGYEYFSYSWPACFVILTLLSAPIT
ncbi:hypothetical protein AVDCRST_MAG94-1512 [uncultured Leptolyngbya sp.]|uniref:Uncharacterized protein n=1 Tax=uncultured Leptolyngbya sp. TaxID=332963 RepID=A0A6J4L3Z7_9CYAN|nr:hypothetical protein AVDCRST_MAG94-1512 [uncultured Leptolyngbya sp.]